MSVGAPTSSTTTAQVYSLAQLAISIADEHTAADAAVADGENLGRLMPFLRLASELGGSWLSV
ncbi:MAG: hypothetical protein WB681_05755 [Candidatus Cybelea sp.]